MENEYIYLNALKDVLENGTKRNINYPTISKFSLKLDFNIKNNFPLITTKKVYWKGVLYELLWFIKGYTDSKILERDNINIWKDNSSRECLDHLKLHNYEEGDCGPIYGFQWRHFGTVYKGCNYNYNGLGIDQLNNCINLIKNNPTSKRILMTSWNPVQLNDMCIQPSNLSYQFYLSDINELSCILYQRCVDMYLGLPFNIASVSLLVYLLAHITNNKPGHVSIIIGEGYIENINDVKEQLNRKPNESPTLSINKKYSNINDYKYQHFDLHNYNYYST